jgi:hypothetical protein
VIDTPAGRLLGHAGGTPGFLSIALSTSDGGRQLALMVNARSAPDPVTAAFITTFQALSERLLADSTFGHRIDLPGSQDSTLNGTSG